MKEFDAEEARAHIILLRDGLYSVSDIFNRTKSVPDRYIRKYWRTSGLEDIKHIAYAAHIYAIQTFPVNSSMNFFAWAANTVRREVVQSIRLLKRHKDAVAALSKSGEFCVGSCEEPEESFLGKERSQVITKHMLGMGKKNFDVITSYIDDEQVYGLSYFKQKKRREYCFNELRKLPELRDFCT